MTRIAGLASPLPETDIVLSRMIGTANALCCTMVPKTTAAAGPRMACAGRGGRGGAECDGIAVVLDGFVYDRREFDDGVDAAALARAFRRDGFEATIKSINGDFALAAYDSKTETLWLARDRLGVRPLYYASTRGVFGFASLPTMLFSLPGIEPRPRPEFVALFAASHYRYFDNKPESSPYEGIAQLPPAHVLRLRLGQVTVRPYWTLEEAGDDPGPEHELALRYRELLEDAVTLRTRVAEAPAFTLSGGMDSSSVLALAVRAGGVKAKAYTTVYDDKTYDESLDIQPMLGGLVETWCPVPVNLPDVFAIVEEMVVSHGEPVATATWLSHYLLCRQASADGVKVLFGGLGGDEINAGEYEHYYYYFADLRANGMVDLLATEVECWARHHDHPLYPKSRKVLEAELPRLVDFRRPGRCLPNRQRLCRYLNALNPDYFDLEHFEPVMDHPFRSYLKNRTYQDLTRETIPCCLRAEDRNAAAFGLDVIMPFFDHRLVEFMFRVPSVLKYRDGISKHLLRVAMCGLLPELTRTRIKKTGWNAPAHLWFSGPGADVLLDMTHSRAFRDRGIYNLGEVERLIAEHRRIVAEKTVAENHMMFLWQLVNLELWFRAFVDGER